MLQETFLTSMNPRPTVLNISIGEIINLHSILLEMQESMIEERNSIGSQGLDQQEDFYYLAEPIFNLLAKLGSIPKAKFNERKLRMNMYLKTNVISICKALYKCSNCGTPLPSKLAGTTTDYSQGPSLISADEEEKKVENELQNEFLLKKFDPYLRERSKQDKGILGFLMEKSTQKEYVEFDEDFERIISHHVNSNEEKEKVIEIPNSYDESENQSSSSEEPELSEEEKELITLDVQYREGHREYQDNARRIMKDLEEKITMMSMDIGELKKLEQLAHDITGQKDK